MNDTNATVEFEVTAHTMIPSTDITPQARSKGESFQVADLLMNEATKTHIGPTPKVRVITDCNPTPWLNSAAKARMGAMDHSVHVTRLGWAFPLIVCQL
jgi:hypothetical protein